MLTPVNAETLQQAHLFHNHLAVTSHETEDLEFKPSLPPPKKVFWSTRRYHSGKHALLFILDPLCIKIQEQWHGVGGRMWTRETDSHIHYLGYLPLTARFRSWSQLQYLTLCSRSENKAKPALINLGSGDQIPCVSPASRVSYLVQCNVPVPAQFFSLFFEYHTQTLPNYMQILVQLSKRYCHLLT